MKIYGPTSKIKKENQSMRKIEELDRKGINLAGGEYTCIFELN